MKVVKIKCNVSVGYSGSIIQGIVDVHIDDDLSHKDIEIAKDNAARVWMFKQIDWGWCDIDEYDIDDE